MTKMSWLGSFLYLPSFSPKYVNQCMYMYTKSKTNKEITFIPQISLLALEK